VVPTAGLALLVWFVLGVAMVVIYNLFKWRVQTRAADARRTSITSSRWSVPLRLVHDGADPVGAVRH
jgi:hypothetical protein